VGAVRYRVGYAIRADLKAVAEFEREQGAFSDEEIAEADQSARDALERSKRGGLRRKRSA
jgi:hypothetical protein